MESVIVFSVLVWFAVALEKPEVEELSVRMPNVVAPKEDALMCHASELEPEEAYIVAFKPHASRDVAHHMMVYGCGQPGSNQSSWACGEMDDTSDRSVCGDGERQILWAWAMDAEGKAFPPDVGFRVGGDTGINHVVIQIHYTHASKPNETDTSGVTIQFTKNKLTYQAGYYVLYTYGYIPPHTQDYHLETACDFVQNYSIFPLAYRTHAHSLGVVTSGYQVRDGRWTEIGRMSPQLPQTFYNVTNPGLEVKKGDILAARCTMSSERDFPTVIGPRNEDEMCNFYILYYTAHRGRLRVQYCLRDARTFHWRDYMSNLPASASSTSGLPPFTRHDPHAAVST
ncbi:peptidylglycine alpha-hydroxylating monooxygenase-like [Mya arenaria]|uniref:peptidylglycine alpha-hydroxylating monooxygenase-like n=1 Tax=Mya arenaria TaxID=6604 RepID=UPI0022E268EE|nr:peptidylglycine alpha-hydroxylating monooxygenase-like [Mya arenaria]